MFVRRYMTSPTGVVNVVGIVALTTLVVSLLVVLCLLRITQEAIRRTLLFIGTSLEDTEIPIRLGIRFHNNIGHYRTDRRTHPRPVWPQEPTNSRRTHPVQLHEIRV